MSNYSTPYPGAKPCHLGSPPAVASRLRRQVKVVSLKRGEVIQLKRKTGVKYVETQNGIVWLTGTPANGDVLLLAGEQFELQNKWPYVIEALEPSDLLLISDL